MAEVAEGGAKLDARIREAMQRVWGFTQLRPLQEEAIAAGLERRDSLVVMPTGGGKSLCYQLPPLVANRTDVVVSPLISLMKDQVDGLQACGYPAFAFHSGVPAGEQRAAEADLLAGRLRLVFVAPERLLTPRFLDLLRRAKVRSIAVDEAHCISHWGHDFRPEYRRLGELRERFGDLSIHAFTATATPRVRDDIVAQLKLRDPAVLVGTFDRPNLTYRIVPRADLHTQVRDILMRHNKQAAIVYCISRKDTENLATWLKSCKFRAEAYHAGMDAEARRRTQDAFASEELDVIVATVAFGMGVDRSDVRCIIHAAMSKTIEHYQQETGRAGRDGMPAECVLLYSAGDAFRWERLLTMPPDEPPADPVAYAAARDAQLVLLEHMRRYCAQMQCRHRALSGYFGQNYPAANCRACDVCLKEVEGVEDATVAAQKILSCVARVQQRFGVGHVVDVLLGAQTERLRQLGHDKLSTYGLMKEFTRKELINLVHQLIDQNLLLRTDDEYPVLRLNGASWEVMRSQRLVSLQKSRRKKVRASAAEQETWRGVDRDLFENLRELRRELAKARGVPPFLIFSDATLRELAVARPRLRGELASIYGLGKRKIDDFGDELIRFIQAACGARPADRPTPPLPYRPGRKAASDRTDPSERKARSSGAKLAAFSLFAERRGVEEVAAALNRRISTVSGYLCEYIEEHRPASIEAWVDRETYATIAEAAQLMGTKPLRPLMAYLEERIPGYKVKVAVVHMEALGEADQRRD